jgi:hypothetical protein
MKNLITIIVIALFGLPLHSAADEFDAEQFAHSYFSAWTASQKPAATEKELEHYLGFLAEDVGHQHLPYDTDDSRSPDGKESMREGMTYYLGKHTEYKAELKNISYGLNAIAIQFEVSLKARRGPDEPITSMNYTSLEVLEIEDGKVSMIRKYN